MFTPAINSEPLQEFIHVNLRGDYMVATQMVSLVKIINQTSDV